MFLELYINDPRHVFARPFQVGGIMFKHIDPPPRARNPPAWRLLTRGVVGRRLYPVFERSPFEYEVPFKKSLLVAPKTSGIVISNAYRSDSLPTFTISDPIDSNQ